MINKNNSKCGAAEATKKWWTIRQGRLSLIAIALPLAMGCSTAVAGADAPRDATMAQVQNYQPTYYDGYVVYYNTAGAPYYYYDGSPVSVPATYSGYNALVENFNAHEHAYGVWHDAHGQEVISYRDPGHRVDGVDHALSVPMKEPRSFASPHEAGQPARELEAHTGGPRETATDGGGRGPTEGTPHESTEGAREGIQNHGGGPKEK